MNKILLAAMTAGAIGLAFPAAAQVYVGSDPDGVGVRVGPFGADVGPGWRHRHYAGDCRVIRERIVTPSGRVIYRSTRECD